MCRHLAYLGPPVTLHELLLAPPHSLLEQSWAPRFQRCGTVNADGFGIGWWDHARRPEPARYRRGVPMWTDRSLASMAGLVSSSAVVAAVRSATPPLPSEETGAAPFTAGPWLFSFNGAVPGWADGTGVALRRQVSDRRAAGMEGVSDGEVLFALVLDHLDRGRSPAAALAATVELAGGRLNLLLSDGHQVTATACGDSLFLRRGTSDVVVASEPFDDDPAWEAVPDASMVQAVAGRATVAPL